MSRRRVLAGAVLLCLVMGFATTWLASWKSQAEEEGRVLRQAGNPAGAPISEDSERASSHKLQERPEKILAPERASLRRQLDRIAMPVIEFDDTSMEEAIDFVRLRLREVEMPVPQRGGSVFKATAGFEPPHMSFSMRDAPVSEVLERIAEATGFKLWIEGDYFVFLPRDADDLVFRKGDKSATWNQAVAVEIPVVSYDREMSLREAVDDLNTRGLEGPKVTIDAGVEDSLKVGRISLRNAPLSDVVQLLVAGTRNRVTVAGDEIRIVANGDGNRRR